MLLKIISKLNVYSFFIIGCIIALGLITIIGCSSGGGGGGGGDDVPTPGLYGEAIYGVDVYGD
jgi:hypothetical protein